MEWNFFLLFFSEIKKIDIHNFPRKKIYIYIHRMEEDEIWYSDGTFLLSIVFHDNIYRMEFSFALFFLKLKR